MSPDTFHYCDTSPIHPGCRPSGVCYVFLWVLFRLCINHSSINLKILSCALFVPGVRLPWRTASGQKSFSRCESIKAMSTRIGTFVSSLSTFAFYSKLMDLTSKQAVKRRRHPYARRSLLSLQYWPRRQNVRQNYVCSLRIGPRCDILAASINSPSGQSLPWVNEMRYLDVSIVQSLFMKCSLDACKRVFTVLPTVFWVKLAELLRKKLFCSWSLPNAYLLAA